MERQMRRTTAALGSVIFFALAPGVVAGLIPWWLTGWRLRQPFSFRAMTPLRVVGVAVARLTTASWPVNTAANPEQSNSDTDAGIAPCVVIAAAFSGVRASAVTA